MQLITSARRAAWREEIQRMRDAWSQLSPETRTTAGDAGMLFSQTQWLVDKLELALLNLDVVMQRPIDEAEGDAR